MNKLMRNSFFILLLLSSIGLSGADWKPIANLSGTWSFTVGDNPEWSKPGTDISDWTYIKVPGRWENSFPGYNGYGWYRKTFDIRETSYNEYYQLFLGRIDDVDEVFVNGVKVGQSGRFFPDYQSAYNSDRQYTIPASLLKKENNVIAIRVLDEGNEGGILYGRHIGIYYDSDINFLIYNLAGKWKFSTKRYHKVEYSKFDDSDWDEIVVPGKWEHQGYPEYDGFAWYRKNFKLEKSLLQSKLYLIAGKIDDMDEVYINGEMIGQVEDLDHFTRFTESNAYNLYRIYEIPFGLLKEDNTIVVEVLDEHGMGGIYEGPIGLMERDEVNDFKKKYRYNFEENPINRIIDLIFD